MALYNAHLRYLVPDYLFEDTDYALRDMVRDYVETEIFPKRQQIDDDKDHVIVNELIGGLMNMGFQRVTFPEDLGGMGLARAVAHCMSLEEVARGDSGIAVAMACTSWPFIPLALEPEEPHNRWLFEQFAPQFCGEERHFACFAMTEPASGCDVENPHMKGKRIGTRARLEGDEWVINGSKMWPTNAGISSVYLTVCTTDPELGDEGIAMIYVPAPTEGLSFGKFENKVGMQADRNCAIYYDNVRVPKEYRAAGPGRDAELLHQNLVIGRICSAAMALGNAQRTFEEVVEYAGTRIVGGKPIREHSINAGILADMAIGIETARNYMYNVAYMFDHPEEYGQRWSLEMLARASVAKVHACDVAIFVTNKAMELMASYGYVREYNVEKYWRDVKEIQLWLGGAQLGRLDVSRGMYGLETI